MSSDDFDAYVAAAWPRLVRAAMLLGCSHHEAEDLVQATLTRCLVKWSRVTRADDRDAYVYRMLVNTHATGRRRRWHGERATEHLPERRVPDHTAEVVERDAVRRALLELPTDLRVAVVLRYYLNLPEARMATVLDVPPGTVKSRLSRALRALAKDRHLAEAEGR